MLLTHTLVELMTEEVSSSQGDITGYGKVRRLVDLAQEEMGSVAQAHVQSDFLAKILCPRQTI